MAKEDENVMNILVASDVHVGYKEKDPVCGEDSLVTLKEIFDIAKQRNADFILLGGDLFHENKPSRKILHATMELFRKFCLGNRPCQVEVISDQSVNFGHTSSSITCVNYEHPHMNIEMPVFSIHGNHDDPTGAGELSAIDLLSVAGLLNHFGKQTVLDKIEITPVLLQKGNTKVALYGLGSIRDERLHRLFLHRNVTYFRPGENTEQWFNLLVLHQNRSKHGPTNYIPEQFVDEFFDLVIWGHEHECLIEPQWNSVKNFMVMQPGSSVATSLCEAEAKQKHVALLTIKGREMKVEKIPLRTVRQMYVETIVLADCIHTKMEDPVQAAQTYCKERVERLLMQADDEKSNHNKQPKKPLIRLRIDYSNGFDTFSAHRFGAEFVDRVANPGNIVHFLKKSVKRESSGIDVSDMDAMIGREVVEKVKMEDLVREYLKEEMTLLSAAGVSTAVGFFVDKQEKDAIYELCNHQIDKTRKHLLNMEEIGDSLDRDVIIDAVRRFRVEREQSRSSGDAENGELHEILARARAMGVNQTESLVISDEDDPMKVVNGSGRSSTRATRGRSRGRGSRRGSAAKKDTSLGRGADILSAFKRQSQRQAQSVSRDDDDVIMLDDVDDNGSEYSQRQSSRPTKGAQKRGRNKGVMYVSSSEEEDNPFHKTSSFRKKKR